MSGSQSALHYEQGKLCYQNKKFEDAIFQFTEAIRLKPDTDQATARCHNARGVVHFYLGEFKKVIKDCTKAIELDPNNANYHNCRGNAFFSLGKFAKAAEDFSRAIELSPEATHGRYYNNRGSAYRRLKNFKEAIEDYTLAINVDPKNGNYYNNRGNTYFDMGEFQLAIDDFTTALGLEPYSPKTKLTLAQAHEALQQEKRMKNSTQFQGIYSSIKARGTKSQRRKERVADIYVSPAGVEVTYMHGWRKTKEQVSFAWSEDMRIELVDDSKVKLILNRTSDPPHIIITPCDGTAVEEELIGRITTKFASYSTACLVAQHEGVCNEYADLVRTIDSTKKEVRLLKDLLAEAEEQKAQYVATDKFKEADLAKAQVAGLREKLEQRTKFIEQELTRAELVRTKAEAEAGPVLDMVLIMQNRVQELYQTRIKRNPDKYRVEDLALEEQVQKMEDLVSRARELAHLVARPLREVEEAFERGVGDEEEEEVSEEDEPDSAPVEEAAAEPEPTPEPTPAPAQAVAAPPAEAKVVAAPVKTLEDLADSDDDEDWDAELDDLPDAFAAQPNEIMMTVEQIGGMVQIRPQAVGSTGAGVSGSDMVMLKRDSLIQLTEEQKQAQAKLAEEAEAKRKLEADLEGKESALVELQRTNENLQSLKDYYEGLKAELKGKLQDMEAKTAQMGQTADMSQKEREELQQQVEKERSQINSLQGSLQSVNTALASKVAEAEEQAERCQQLETKSSELQSMIDEMKAATQAQTGRLAEERDEFKGQLEQMNKKSAELQEQLGKVAEEKQMLEAKVEEQTMTLAEMRRHLREMQNQLQQANEEKAQQADQMAAIEQQAKAAEKEKQHLREQAAKEELKRRQLHNLIQDLRGNIRVYVKIRPDFAKKNPYQLFSILPGSDGRGLQVTGPPEASATGGATAESKTWDFEFDRIFPDTTTQPEVFSEISELVQSALDGYSVSIFAYGQTGSGKTYTMEGPEDATATNEVRGVIPRAVEQIFSYRDSIAGKGWTYTCSVSFLEIYVSTIRDLLSGDAESKLDIRTQKLKKGSRTYVEGLTAIEVSNAAELAPLLDRAAAARSTASTSSNARSSRSHSVFTMTIKGVHSASGTTSEGRLNLIDLAGSERIDKSKVTGQRLEETKAINTSLTCLGDVIAAVASGAKHIPYRNSKLTYLLQDSFGNGAKTLMFANLSGEVTHIQESLCTLRFAKKVHASHVGPAQKSLKSGGAKKKKKSKK